MSLGRHTMYLAELHFGNGYMEIGLLISSLHDPNVIDISLLGLIWLGSTMRAALRYCGKSG